MNLSHLGFGFFSLKIYGVILAILVGIVSWIYYKKLQEKKFPIDFFVHHFWRWMLAGVVLGRLFSLLFDVSIISRHGVGSFLSFWDGTINFYGFCLGAILMLFYDTKKKQFSAFRWLDLMVIPSFILIFGIDIANFLTGNSYGTPTILPWGIQYQTFGVNTLDPVHPVSIYGLILHLILFVFLAKISPKYENKSGKLFIIFVIIFFGIEFFLNFLRGDDTWILFNIFRIDQILAFIFLAVGLFFLKKKFV